jgi:D-3-phosphoglycerate dehydrogenase
LWGAPVLTAFIVDFDSTLVRVEGLEVLAEVALQGEPDGEDRRRRIAALTDQAMSGELAFEEALAHRLALLRPRRSHIDEAVARLAGEISPSAQEHAAFFASPDVYVVSGGFHEMIDPVVARLGVPVSRVLANSFVFDEDGCGADFDRSNPVGRSGGKADAVRGLHLTGEVVVIGDGWTDYEIRAAGAADRFYAFVENVERPRVVAHADRIARSFGDVLRQEGLLP